MRSLRSAAAIIAATGIVLAGCSSADEGTEASTEGDVQESEAEIPYFYDYGC